MSDGHRTLILRIDHKELRKTSPEAARQAVVDYWKNNGHNIAEVARVFGINRCVVYDILGKWTAGDLRDRPKAWHHEPNKSPPPLEDKVIAAKTRLGPERLSRYLQRYEQISVPVGTIRHILARSKEPPTIPAGQRRRRQEKRPFVDWYLAKPIEIVQIDLKLIRDHKALSKDQITHLERHDIPNC